MKKELNKKEIKKHLSFDLIFIKIIFYEKCFFKNSKNLRVKYVLIMHFGSKSNLGRQINCQGRYFHEVGK